MKSFNPQPWMLPQPVLIVGTYDNEGRPNAMNVAWSGQWDAHEIMISMFSLYGATKPLDKDRLVLLFFS